MSGKSEAIGAVVYSSSDMSVHGKKEKGGPICVSCAEKSPRVHIAGDMGNGGEGCLGARQVVYCEENACNKLDGEA